MPPTPAELVEAALFASDGERLMARAAELAVTTRDRQLVAIAAAHLRGDRELVDALARDHLVDHPDNVLFVARIAGEAAALRALNPGATMNAKLTAGLLILAAVLANVGFTALGSIFNYPDVLDEPAGSVLADFHANQTAIGGWFAVLALSSALFAPIAIGVARLSTHRLMRIAVPVGIAAAVVQVVGLSRWPILVPGYASDVASADRGVAAAARDSFTTASDILGTAIGETLGYALTATWTALAVVALGRRFGGRWLQVLGGVSAALVFVGVFSPLGVEAFDTANFFGYVLFSVWLIALAVVILRRERRATAAAAAGAASGSSASAVTARGAS